MTYYRSSTRYDRWDLPDTTAALAALVTMLDELDSDGLELSCGMSASPIVDDDGNPTGKRTVSVWVEAASLVNQ